MHTGYEVNGIFKRIGDNYKIYEVRNTVPCCSYDSAYRVYENCKFGKIKKITFSTKEEYMAFLDRVDEYI